MIKKQTSKARAGGASSEEVERLTLGDTELKRAKILRQADLEVASLPALSMDNMQVALGAKAAAVAFGEVRIKDLEAAVATADLTIKGLEAAVATADLTIKELEKQIASTPVAAPASDYDAPIYDEEHGCNIVIDGECVTRGTYYRRIVEKIERRLGRPLCQFDHRWGAHAVVMPGPKEVAGKGGVIGGGDD
jgi:ethanolamine utilization microcompartment shell protein EutS